MKKRFLVLLVAISVVLGGFSSVAGGHSGRTDSQGGHNCYVGSCAGTYHFHSKWTPAPATVPKVKTPVPVKPATSDTSNTSDGSDGFVFGMIMVGFWVVFGIGFGIYLISRAGRFFSDWSRYRKGR